MNYFLAKTDPEEYSIADLQRDKQTVWDGVKNPQALQAIRAMKKGDKVFIYHSGGESKVTGLAKVVAAPRPDPEDPRAWVVELQFLTLLSPGATLQEIKDSGLFQDWSLVRQSRLSTMAAPQAFVDWMRARHPKVRI